MDLFFREIGKMLGELTDPFIKWLFGDIKKELEINHSKGDHYLEYWGGVKNDNWIERDLGIKDTEFWFDSKGERSDFKDILNSVAEFHGEIICFREERGLGVHYKTIADMEFEYQNKRYHVQEDYGYGYPASSAKWLIEEGNDDCDCNRSIIIGRKYKRFPGLDCGDDIKLIDLKFIYRQ